MPWWTHPTPNTNHHSSTSQSSLDSSWVYRTALGSRTLPWMSQPLIFHYLSPEDSACLELSESWKVSDGQGQLIASLCSLRPRPAPTFPFYPLLQSTAMNSISTKQACSLSQPHWLPSAEHQPWSMPAGSSQSINPTKSTWGVRRRLCSVSNSAELHTWRCWK